MRADSKPTPTILSVSQVRRPALSGEASRRRFAAIDVARGVALAAMVVFHSAFDLSTLHLAPIDIEGVGWRSFAKLIASSFLFLSGISLVIAHGAGFRAAAYVRRLAILIGAAALVTLGTWYAMPEQFIFFGILHSIAAASLIGILFLRLQAVVTLVIALCVFVISKLFASPIFDAPALVWLGLGTVPPATLDFEPVFPWLSPFLLGMAVAQFGLAPFARSAVADWQPQFSVGRFLAFTGRYSLWIYLAHQPIIFGTLMVVAQLATGNSPIPAQDRPFVEACQTTCINRGGTNAACLAYCVCTAGELKKAGLWESVLADRYTSELRQRLAVAMQVCARNRGPGSQP
jgi:uncharacterized membrane protein